MVALAGIPSSPWIVGATAPGQHAVVPRLAPAATRFPSSTSSAAVVGRTRKSPGHVFKAGVGNGHRIPPCGLGVISSPIGGVSPATGSLTRRRSN